MTPPLSTHTARDAAVRPWPRFRGRVAQAAKLGLALLCLLSTFAFLTAGMSQPQAKQRSPTNRSGESATRTGTPGRAKSAANNRSQLQATIQREWESQLAAASLSASPPADWLTVCRRLSLAMVGSGLSLEEIRALERLPLETRIQRHRESLLADPRFHDYWAERFTRFYVGADDGPFLVYRRRRFRTWLSEQFAAGVRYDDLVRRLITAHGKRTL